MGHERRDEEASDVDQQESDSDLPRQPGIILAVLMSYGEGVGLFSFWRFPNMLVKHGGENMTMIIRGAILTHSILEL